MKKQFKAIIALAAAVTMTMSPVLLAHADELPPEILSDRVMNVPYAETVNGLAADGFRHTFSTFTFPGTTPAEMNVVAKVSSADEYFTSIEQELWYIPVSIRSDFASYTPEGYAWHFLTGDYCGVDMQQNYGDCYWWYGLTSDDTKDWKTIESESDEFFTLSGFFLRYKFTTNVNGVDYPECKVLRYSGYDDYHKIYSIGFAILLPQNYNGDFNLYLSGGTLVNNEVVRNDVRDVTYQIVQKTSAQTASVWKQDSKGWWVENPDGTYLKNEWYQSPSNGLWYYLGNDGYMLTNTTTPDGCRVNAEGVWVQ